MFNKLYHLSVQNLLTSNFTQAKNTNFGIWVYIYIYIFFSLFFLKFFKFFYFTILYWFCNTLTWICHGCTWVLNPEPPSHLPPQIISLGHPSAPAPSILYPVLNLDWRFVSYTIVYMFQCYSPKSSHPLPLPQSPKSVLYICVSFAVSHTGLSLPSF